jgi:hypothetical protein
MTKGSIPRQYYCFVNGRIMRCNVCRNRLEPICTSSRSHSHMSRDMIPDIQNKYVTLTPLDRAYLQHVNSVDQTGPTLDSPCILTSE